MAVVLLRRIYPGLVRRGARLNAMVPTTCHVQPHLSTGRSDKKLAWSIVLSAAAVSSFAHQFKATLCDDAEHKTAKSRGLRATDIEHDKTDPLSHQIKKTFHFPISAAEVMPILCDVASWEDFVPHCAKSRFIKDLGNKHQLFEVGFGLSLGRFFVGDTVLYEASQPEGGVLLLQSRNNDQLKYVDTITYALSVKDASEGCELTVHLAFHARNSLYLRTWNCIQDPLVEAMAHRLKLRASVLGAAYGHDMVGC